MRKLIKIIILIIALFMLPMIVSASAEQSLDQAVSFGLTRSEGGQFVPVFEEAGSKHKTDLLSPNWLCALDYSTIQGKYYWYHIVYLDDTGEPKEGYVKESNFEQLTVSSLAEMAANPETNLLIDRYIALEKTSPLFLGKKTEDQNKQHYMLNTNTKKFHYPDCRSVKKMKNKNRKDYTGTRDEIIEMGFVPCKNCNP